jgi:hypothetical protein
MKQLRKSKIQKYKTNQVFVSKKECFICKETKPSEKFGKRCEYSDGLEINCKTCTRKYKADWEKEHKTSSAESDRRYREENRLQVRASQKAYRLANKEKYAAWSAKRRAAKLQRLPKWADLKAIQKFYENCPSGMTVDHIVPLQGEFVTGLHVENNLQYLTMEENSKKNNRIDLDAFNKQFSKKFTCPN